MTPFWQTGQGPVSLGGPLYLGILNATPDSFSDGGRFQDDGRIQIQDWSRCIHRRLTLGSAKV